MKENSSSFVTVSGQVENTTNPFSLYKNMALLGMIYGIYSMRNRLRYKLRYR